MDIVCFEKLTVFLELRSRKTVRFSEQIMSADKYPSIFSRQIKAIVYIYIYIVYVMESALYGIYARVVCVKNPNERGTSE